MRLYSNKSQKTSKCGKNIIYTHCTKFLFLPHSDVIRAGDQLLNSRTATWNLFVKDGSRLIPRKVKWDNLLVHSGNGFLTRFSWPQSEFQLRLIRVRSFWSDLDEDQWSKIARIVLHQRSRWIHSGHWFIGSCDAPQYESGREVRCCSFHFR